MLPFLEEMARSEKDVEWSVSDSAKFSYKLREAMSVAARLGVEHAGLKGRFMIRQLPNGRVRAELRVKTPFTMAQRALAIMSIPEATDLHEIIGAIIANRSGELISFPNAWLNEEDEVKLQEWCTLNKYVMKKGEQKELTIERNS